MTARARAVLALVLLLSACSADTGTDATGTGGSGAGATDVTPPAPSVSIPPTPLPSEDLGEDVSPDPFVRTAVRTRFAGRILAPLPSSLAREMRGETWEPGCPVPLSDLALLRFNYVDFEDRVERGPMVVNAAVAEDVLGVFRTLFRAGFPIRRVVLAKRFRPNADPNTRASVTASFNCRPVVTPDGPGETFSQHAWGLAVDVNSLQNPYVGADGSVRNRFARPYVDRSQDLPGMIHEGDVVVRAFAAIGWEWGGDWSGGEDYMHFSMTGR